MSDQQQQQPSLIGGHAQYVKGAAEVLSHPNLITIPIPHSSHLLPLNPSQLTSLITVRSRRRHGL